MKSAVIALVMLFVLMGLGDAGRMITPNNPAGFMFHHEVLQPNGNRTVYIETFMLPNPESGITFVPMNEGCGCLGGGGSEDD